MDAINGQRQLLPILWFVVPCYNEEDVLPKTVPLFLAELEDLVGKDKIDASSKVCCVNDGSKDATWDIICDFSRRDERVEGMSLSRNRGHQNALLAGLMEARFKCDATISIDCDGQDDIKASEKMIDAYLAGAEIVYGARSRRETDTFFK